ncbi:hypothetical protein OPT61_g5672 [Boeremia exigua]|uniref:Uncharacterized protein n=1 Tax=Boeremia exigua TaxID=749465 RepID=A0ACC2I9G7_9PLEO|nr:hypothetical protein OPT61_g5672 [Boeremia exigua]
MENNLDTASDGQSASSSSRRLPVNPRRHKVAPDQRKRVVRACNACNNRRVKCSGEQPCERCIATSRECIYTASETELERLRARCSALEEGLKTITPHQAPDLLRQLNRGEVPSWADVAFSPRSPSANDSDDGHGRLLHDPDGAVRYLGETSGATFLDQLKHFIRTVTESLTLAPGSENGSSFVASVGSYQTYDSRPLPNPTVKPDWLPPPQEMDAMLRELRQYIQDGNGTFRSGGIYWWGNLENPPTSSASSTPMERTTINDSYRHLAFYQACFALSVSLRHSSLQLQGYQSGEAYFKRARILLGNPMDTVHFSLNDVPALALMGYYLIEVNRRDAAYIYATDEPSKRTFWTLYILDRWISMLMGRPPIIPDEAIRLPLPAADSSMPPCLGLCANIELARISGYIVCETYGIAPRYSKPARSGENIDEALKMLHDWYSRLPVELQPPTNETTLDPACCTLHMCYNQLIILSTRPVFFAAVKKATAQRFLRESSTSLLSAHHSHARSCIEAAQRNLELARLLQTMNRNWLQSGLHFLFNAAVILLLDRLHSANKDEFDPDCAEGQYTAEIGFAIRVFEQEAKTGTNYPRDCCRVLQDLDALTDRYAVAQRRLIPQHPSPGRKLHTLVSQPATPSQQTPSHGSKDDTVFLENLMTWKQNGGLHPNDMFSI